jgi:F-type H+-transporting ATPase subunit gamma
MEQLEALKKKINSAQDLHSVVTTMKSLAAVHIHEYERAVKALDVYNQTVEAGLQVLLQQRPEPLAVMPVSTFPSGQTKGFGAVIFGSEQGMCGQFNRQIAEYALQSINSLEIQPEHRRILALGQRVVPDLEELGLNVDERLALLSTSGGIGRVVQHVVLSIEAWRARHQIEQIVIFYNHPLSSATYQPTKVYLLPLNMEWLQSLAARPWDSRSLPLITMEWEPVFLAVLREYFFVVLYRAVVNSLASENASRLAAMQAAERSIEERLEELGSLYQRQRQNSITMELLDIVSGFEALTGGPS